MTFMGNADAQGKFEVQLMPGSYGLSVIAPPDLKPPEPEPDGPALAWRRTWYPGVVLPEAASKIVVLPGEVSDVELKLLAVPAHAVRGVVLNPDGTPAPKVTIAIGETFRSASVESKADGTFEFPAVPEGEWRISVETQRGSGKLFAIEWMEVARHDLENVKLHLIPPLTVHGKVVAEASQDPSALKPGPLILVLAGGRTRRDGDLRSLGGSMVSLDARGDSIISGLPRPLPSGSPVATPAATLLPRRSPCRRRGSGHTGRGDLLRHRDQQWCTNPTVAPFAVRRRTAPRAVSCWSPPTLPCGAQVSPNPDPAIPPAATKFARSAPATTMHWPSPGTDPCWR